MGIAIAAGVAGAGGMNRNLLRSRSASSALACLVRAGAGGAGVRGGDRIAAACCLAIGRLGEHLVRRG